jgi:hypothetical protein
MNGANEMICEPRTFKRRIRIFSSTRRIDVRFIAIESFQLKIKHAMKTSTLFQNNKPIIPSLFQVASRIEDFVPAVVSKSAPPLEQTPFVELMLHPDKLEAALKIAKVENDAFDAARTYSRQGSVKRATRSAFKNRGSVEKSSNRSLVELKPIEFHVQAPSARSVKLAADFTDWEKYPLDMMKSEDGVWFTNVPLSPGQYSYRFIVDGQWCDDPRSVQRVPNPFGTANAVVNVT